MSLSVLIPLVAVTGAAVGIFLVQVIERSSSRPRGARAGPSTGGVVVTNMTVWVLLSLGLYQHFLAALPAFLLFGSVLVVQSWIDLRERRLPRMNTFTGIALGAPGLAVAALIIDEPERMWMAVLGAIVALILIGAMYVISNAIYGNDVAFGFGDVLLSPLLGLYLGWLNPGFVGLGLFLGFLLASVAAIIGLVFTHADAKSQLPFGPFLAIGALAMVIAGQPFVDAVFA